MSPGTNSGTGQPLGFMCAKARLIRPGIDQDWARARHAVELTGKSRPGPKGVRMTGLSLQYRCDCGHVGWSAHYDLPRVARRTEDGPYA